MGRGSADAILQAVPGDEVDRRTKNLFEFSLDVNHVEQVRTGREVDEQVQVTVSAVVAACGAAEDLGVRDSVTA